MMENHAHFFVSNIGTTALKLIKKTPTLECDSEANVQEFMLLNELLSSQEDILKHMQDTSKCISVTIYSSLCGNFRLKPLRIHFL